MINEIKFDKGENEGIMRNSVIPPNQPEGDFALAGGKRSKSRKKEKMMRSITFYLSRSHPFYQLTNDHTNPINRKYPKSPSFYPKLYPQKPERKSKKDLEEFRTQKLHLSPLP